MFHVQFSLLKIIFQLFNLHPFVAELLKRLLPQHTSVSLSVTYLYILFILVTLLFKNIYLPM